ncbi:MAG: integrase arm-type DNA-binding domain-containing protein [Pseudomonadota bacterium]
MPLTDIAIRTAKPKDKAYKLTDGGGLFLFIQPNGGKWWRYKYRFAGKQKLLALGIYPDVSLADVRERHSQARKVLAAGNDPSELKKEAKRLAIMKAENNFESIAREWHETNLNTWTPKHGANIIKRLEGDIFPKLGSRPINDITAPEILSALRLIEKRGALDLTQTIAQYCGRIFSYAIATGLGERNPVTDLRGALKTPVRKHHAYLKTDELPEYLQKLEGYQGELLTKMALKMLMLTFVRTTELRGAEWAEIDMDKAEWRIPASRMKMKDPHIVPLCSQVIDILRELQRHTGGRRHVFANHHKPSTFMSENTMLYALYRMGYHSRTTGHGFRATASTILNENGFAPDVIERQLAHIERNKVRAAYNHAQYLPERRKMMQWWGDYIDAVASNGESKIIPLRQSK